MMNNTTLENSSLLICDINMIKIASISSLILQLPVSIYVLQLIISRRSIASELYIFNEAVFELIICLYDFLRLIACSSPNIYLMTVRRFFLGFIIGGRPCLLALICLDRYLAVVRPVVFMRLKPLKYKLALSGIIFLWTLVSSLTTLLIKSPLYGAILGQVVACCVVKLYCCIATLLALKKPGPGEGVRKKEGMSKIKLKAFRIVLFITISVILIYVPLVIFIHLRHFFTVRQFLMILNGCYICTAMSGFVQSLLFLQRSGKLPCIKWP